MPKFDWTRINNDINGNPRYVIHFLNLLTEGEKLAPSPSGKYEIAIRRGNRLGGRKFHTKQYGGGIVFQSYSLEETEGAILRLLEQEEQKQKGEGGA